VLIKHQQKMTMKKIKSVFFSLIILSLMLTGCGKATWDSYKGQLLGAKDRPAWVPVQPYGMIYVPTGVLHIGPNDQDLNNAMVARSKEVSIQGFYMDETEITNNEYRQFVNYVKDSIAHTILGHFVDASDGSDLQAIDWSKEIEWSDPETSEQLEDMYSKDGIKLLGVRDMDISKIIYHYLWFDWKTAAKLENRWKERAQFFHEENIRVYPDTLVWVRDFTYSYNEPMTRNYFSHPSFDDYPVVGINWDQANAFNDWRTKFWSAYRTQMGEPLLDIFRLPTESEWEYAARGGKKIAQYPWGGPYVRNAKGCILANFKPGRGNYPEDGGFYTVRADAYWPNDYGLYNMAGNVAEWTSTAYYENATQFIWDMNPDIRYDADDSETETLKRKTLRGGSWKDIAHYIQCGTRHWEYQDTSSSYIGFRSITTYLGRDPKDK
jgi:gliding motility-associated lipoprotein GldK